VAELTEEVLRWTEQGGQLVPAVVKQVGGTKGDIPLCISGEKRAYCFFIPQPAKVGEVRVLYWVRKGCRVALDCLLNELYGIHSWTLTVSQGTARLTLPTQQAVNFWSDFYSRLAVERCCPGAHYVIVAIAA